MNSLEKLLQLCLNISYVPCLKELCAIWSISSKNVNRSISNIPKYISWVGFPKQVLFLKLDRNRIILKYKINKITIPVGSRLPHSYRNKIRYQLLGHWCAIFHLILKNQNICKGLLINHIYIKTCRSFLELIYNLEFKGLIIAIKNYDFWHINW